MSNRAPRFLPFGPRLYVTAIALTMILAAFLSAPRLRAADDQPRIWLSGPRPLEPLYHIQTAAAMQSLQSTGSIPLSLAIEDFDQDGIADLAVGYTTSEGGRIAIHRGNLDAFAPQSQASHAAIGRGDFPAPFLRDAQVIEAPVNPDFLAAGRFQGEGSAGLALAARGEHRLYVLSGDGTGQFGAAQAIELPGAVTAMAAFTDGLYSRVLVGVHAGNASMLLEFSGSADGLAPLRSVSLNADPTSFAFGNLDGDPLTDAAVVAGGNLFVLRGSSTALENVPTGLRVSSVAFGSFVSDRSSRLQMAALATDGSVHILVRGDFDPTPYTPEEMQARRNRQRQVRGASPAVETETIPAPSERLVWKEVESLPGVADGEGAPLLMKTRISNNGADDAMTLSHGRLGVLAHPGLAPTGNNPFPPASLMKRTESIQHPVAALSTRVNVDGRPGVVFLSREGIEPLVMMPLPDPTFFVNRIDDPAPTSPIANACNNVSFVDVSSSCSLREAILKANGDTIMLQGLTYTLSRPKVLNDYSGNHGALYMNRSATIVGAVDGMGHPTSIIQAGTNATNGVDLVLAVNADSIAFTDATGSLSNLVIKFGHNNGTFSGNQDGFGGGIEFDTGLAATATLTLTNCTVTNNVTTDGDGGGLALFNTNTGTGFATITNSIIQNNSPVESSTGGSGLGGGIFVGFPAKVVLNNTQVINNTATQAIGVKGQGGGIFIFGGSGSPTSAIHSSTISGNQSAGNGGGIYSTTGLTIDTGTIISNNTSGLDGGGLWYNNIGATASLSKVTITGNNAGAHKGGGIRVDSGAADVFNLSFSRIAGNTATLGGSNLSNLNGTVTAQNNWWGTNAVATTIDAAGGTTTFDPFIVLTHTASPNKIRINQSTTLTADMSKDNHGTGIALSNLGQIIGVPITFNNAVDGSITGAQATIQSNAMATATFNAGGVAGGGKADAVVDQATVTANIIVLQPPSMTKAFNPTTVAVGVSSTITFSITNPNVVTIDSSFTDTLPTGMVVAATPNVVNNCGGTVTATPGAGTISFANPALPVSGSPCTIVADVKGNVDNNYSNSVTIDSSDAGNGNTASGNLTVINPPSISKAFGAATIPLNGTTSLTFTLSSTNVNLTLNGVAYTDSLPAGLVVATPGNLNSTCGGTATAADGSTSVSLSGASPAPGPSCTVSVNVQGITAGVKNNSVQVSSSNGGTGNTSNASITVVAPPTVSKAFNPTSIALNSTSTLGFTVTNPNTTAALSGVAFTDNLPAGVAVAASPNVTGSCGSGTITGVAGSSTISLSGGTLTASPAAGSSCTFSVDVTGTTAGSKSNTTGVVTSTEGGTGATSNTAVLTVGAPPSIAKQFNPATITLNATTSLQFTITNPAANTVALTGVAFTDTLPAGLTVANSISSVCGGTLTTTAPTGISLTGATIAVNSNCQFSVTVTGAASGQYTNTTANVSSTNGGTGNTASANLTVATAPTITKSFNPTSVPLNSNSTLSFTITNPNTNVSLTGVAFTDTLPSGLVVAASPNVTGSCGSGTITAVAGAGTVSLSGGTLTAAPAAGSSCIFSVNVTGTTAGVKNNSVQVTSTEGGTGNTSNAGITVVSPPSISKAFNPTSIAVNASSTLSFTITNPNTTTALSGVAFTDNLPAGVVVATPPNVTGSCGSGTITAVAGSSTISLSGGTLTASPAAGSSCTFSANVTGTTAGGKSNTTGNVTSTEGGTGTTSNTATLTVGKATPTITWGNPADITFGGALSASQLNATASVPGTFVYTPGFGTVLPVGNGQTLSVQFTPTDTADFNNASKNVSINVTAAAGPATLVVTRTLARDVNNDVLVTVTIANTGGSAATSVQLTSAKIGTTSTTTGLPVSLPDIPGGGSVSTTVRFAAGSVGASGSNAVQSVGGSYAGGSFSASGRVQLP